ncbi:MAG: hypothetical protein QOJ42_4308, partial [Acidobacteriaceae bacterium]|nr:hypothetical protein [Acidobacteriaceae bacterium]
SNPPTLGGESKACDKFISVGIYLFETSFFFAKMIPQVRDKRGFEAFALKLRHRFSETQTRL